MSKVCLIYIKLKERKNFKILKNQKSQIKISLKSIKFSKKSDFSFGDFKFYINIFIYWSKLYFSHDIWNYTRGSIFYNRIDL
ncbi:hypothetical protein BpHYR1_033719 [Brachionus plicatilis]|uniref:Uncharacterized protein n=1 Tax=Brachionus plicatilis TaxID=10195 RepID=A0A3M7QS96_BRAPC|nr:hypothetical protein BpHYR1_033719 [Brachionus plicatilis]